MKRLACTVTRRRFLLASAVASLVAGNSKVTAQTVLDFLNVLAADQVSSTALNQSTNRSRRIAKIIQEYDSQGFHRTGTEVDRVCASWLVGHIQQLGLEAIVEKFPISRVDPVQAYVQIGQRRVEGVPAFDGRFTDASGVKGKLGLCGTEADIAVTHVSPNASPAMYKEFQSCRRAGRYKGIIAITRGKRPGLSLLNAPNFTSAFGPPVLQVSSEEAPWLEEAVKQGAEVVLVTQVRRTAVNALNVTTTLKGQQANLAPLVLITPSSGWWRCAGERGGSLACWLEAMKALCAKKPARDVVFVTTSGHELGSLGLKFFLKQHPELVKTALVWLHFGANIGAAVDGGSALFASTEEFEKMAFVAMSQSDAAPDERFPPSHMPYGEVREIHQQGGHYISLLGRNALFHLPQDRWPSAVDVDQVTRFATAFANLIITLAQSGN
jgi:hypothetical protein